jgi:hypothetical protein
MAAIDQLQVQAQWDLDPRQIAVLANQILIQPGLSVGPSQSDGFYLVLGHISPPAFPSAEAAEAARSGGAVLPVVPVARVFVTQERLQDFHRIIGEALNPADSVPVAEPANEEPDQESPYL